MAYNPNLYEPKVVEQYVNELLETKLNAQNFVEIDSSLQSQEGEVVKIYRYSGTGAAEKVAEGAGNVGTSDIDAVSYEYRVQTTQDRTSITDEEAKRNSFAAEKKLDVISSHLINTMNDDIFDQWYDTSNAYPIAGDCPTFAEFLTAQGEVDLGLDGGFNGTDEQLNFFMSPADWRAFQVVLQSANVIIQAEMINGKRQLSVNGIPVQISDLAADGAPFFATNKAVRLVKSTSVGAERERDANTRTTTYYVRDNYVAALEFEDKVCIVGKGLTLTKTAPSHGTFTVPAKTVAGQTVKIADIAPASGYKVSAVSVTKTSGGAAVTTTKVADNLYTFKAPEEAVTVAVTFATV